MANYAYAARAKPTPDDTEWPNGSGSSWHNQPPWPWPDPPYATPVTPPVPLPSSVTGDLNHDTYRFTHIVKSLNQRLVDIGEAASSLNTGNPDRTVSYTQINTARNYIENLYDNYTDSDGDAYANYNAVLVDADPTGVLYGFADVDNGATWTSLDADELTVDSKSDMESSDVFTSWLFTELETALQELTYTGFASVDYDISLIATNISAWGDMSANGNSRHFTVPKNQTVSFSVPSGPVWGNNAYTDLNDIIWGEDANEGSGWLFDQGGDTPTSITAVTGVDYFLFTGGPQGGAYGGPLATSYTIEGTGVVQQTYTEDQYLGTWTATTAL